MRTQIPRPIISLLSEIFSDAYTHTKIDNIFLFADAPGDNPGGNKQDKVSKWLQIVNSLSPMPLSILGKVIEEYMEREITCNDTLSQSDDSSDSLVLKNRRIISNTLARYSLKYEQGGIICKSAQSPASSKLKQHIEIKNAYSIDSEFKRALSSIESDPPASLTAACAIIESVCKVYIEENNLEAPRDASIKPLWSVVAKNLGLDPSSLEDDDLKRILSGLSSIVDGIGALRTHAGSAHGRGVKQYRIQPRHARLAVNAAHTLSLFVLETWELKKPT